MDDTEQHHGTGLDALGDLGRRVLESAPVIILVLDLEGHIVFVNPHFTKLTGHALDDVRGKDWFTTLLPERDRDATRQKFRTAIGGDPTRGHVNPIVTRGGEEREIEWNDQVQVDATGRMIGLLAIGQDVTQRHRAEEALRRTRDQLDATLEALPDLLFETDESGRLFGYHAKRDELLAVPPEQFLGKTLHEVLPPDAADAGMAAIREAGRDGYALGRAYRLQMLDGERWFEPSVSRKAALEGEDQHFILLARDITDRVRAEEAHHAKELQLRVIADNLPVSFCYVDGDQRYLFANRLHGETLGHSPDGVIGKTVREVIGDQVYPLFEPRIRQVLTGERVSYTETYEPPEGGSVSYDINLVPDVDGDGGVRGYFSLVHDVTERTRAAEAVRASEQRLRSILDSMFAFVGLYTPDGVLIEANRAPLEAAGLTREDVIGKPFWDAHWWSYSAETQEQIRTVLARAAAGETVRQDFQVRLRDDVFITLDATFGPLRDATGRVIQLIGSGVDVSARRRAETELEAAQARLNEAQRIAQVGSWELDLTTNTLDWSDEIFRIFEVDRSRFEASYEAFLNAIHPEDRDAVNQAYTASVASRKPYEIAHRLRMADGRIKHVRERCETHYAADGSPVRSVGTVQDVTERHDAEETQRRTWDQLEATLQAIPDLLFELDGGGRYLAVHARRPELLAAAPERLLGSTVVEMLPADAARCVLDALREAAAEGVSFGRTFRMPLPAGERWLELSVARKGSAPGRSPTYVVLSRDITERVLAAQTLKASLAQKSLLLREVHHRVKNNLQVISSLLHLQARRSADPAVLALFDESRSRVRAMAMVHELLCESQDLGRVDFAEYLRNVTRGLFGSLEKKGADLRLSVEADEAFLDIQVAVPCGLIINELMTNVLKYAFPDGRSGEVRVTFRREEGNRWQLSVQDDGVGLPAGVDPLAAETLGLQLVSTLALQLDAVMHVERSPGTRFVLTFAG